METLYLDHVTVAGYTYLLAVGSTGLAFVSSNATGEAELRHYFPHSVFSVDSEKTSAYKQNLAALLTGEATHFNLPIEFHGTPFQIAVWKALQTIPYGKTSTYSAIANQIGRPKAVRAVANAVGRNPNQIVVPCHRVCHKDGSIGGYHGGLPLKRQLLALEAHVVNH